MLIVVLLGLLAIAVGWLIGRPRALLVTVLVPIGAVISRIQQEHNGRPPETWTAATVLFTTVCGHAACVSWSAAQAAATAIGVRILSEDVWPARVVLVPSLR